MSSNNNIKVESDIAWSASLIDFSGLGCDSIINPSAPAAIAALEIAGTKFL